MRIAYLFKSDEFDQKPSKCVTEIVDFFLNEDSKIEMTSADGDDYVSMETVSETDYDFSEDRLLERGFVRLRWTFTWANDSDDNDDQIVASEIHAFDADSLV